MNEDFVQPGRGTATSLFGPRETVAEIAAEREKRVYRECVFCGQPTVGLACRSHRDLLRLDSHFYEMRLRAPNEKGQR